MASYFFYGQSFAGPLNGTTGTFSGALTAATLNLTTAAAALKMGGVTVVESDGSSIYVRAANHTTGSVYFEMADDAKELQIASTGQVTFPATIHTAAGTGALPGVTVGGTADGMYQVASGVVGLGGAGAEVARFSATLAQIPAASVLTWNGATKLAGSTNGTLRVTNNAGSGSVTQLVLDSLDNNGSKIRNNGGGIINFEDGAVTGIAAQTRAGQYLNNNGTYGMFFNTSATFGNGGNSTTTVLGLGTASLTAMSIGSTQNVSFYGTGGFSGTNSGSATNIKSVAANTTLSTGGTTTTIVQIPAGAIVLAVTARVTTAITATLSTSWSLTGGAVTYATAKAFTAGTTVTSADYQATFVGPTFYAAATNLVVTLNTDAALTGAVRAVVHYYDTTAPTA